mmetsp:Transcript_10088/g.14696  ORF Transcript_10088/g.14696 Transcript_10088/m.14696 type:complete len:89 (+) Transcript_10088:36-302(+)
MVTDKEQCCKVNYNSKSVCTCRQSAHAAPAQVAAIKEATCISLLVVPALVFPEVLSAEIQNATKRLRLLLVYMASTIHIEVSPILIAI